MLLESDFVMGLLLLPGSAFSYREICAIDCSTVPRDLIRNCKKKSTENHIKKYFLGVHHALDGNPN